jgi:hypothetical protein
MAISWWASQPPNEGDAANGCDSSHIFLSASSNAMVRSMFPARIQNANLTRPEARSGFGIVDGLVETVQSRDSGCALLGKSHDR